LINGNAPVWTNSHPLWTAWYPYTEYIDKIDEPYTLPKGWTHWDLWQYNDSGRSYGYPSNDYNVFSEAFKNKLNSEWETTAPVSFPKELFIKTAVYKEAI